MSEVTVVLPAPVDQVYAFLADPRRRPEWQPSLRGVALAETDRRTPAQGPYEGMEWHDLTWAVIRPHMWITRMEPYRVWAERGRWRGVTADLTLTFTGVAAGTRVMAAIEVHGAGAWRLPALLAARLAPLAARSDLRRAGRLLAPRAGLADGQ